MRVELELFKQVKIIIYPLASFGIAQIGRMGKFLLTLTYKKMATRYQVAIIMCI